MDNLDFSDLIALLEADEFESKPVDVQTFVTSKDYLGLPPLSDAQYKIVEAGSQIYKRETLVRLLGEERAAERWKQTYNEVIMQLGKGSGKDYVSTITCAYVVYLLLSLKDPAAYYGKPPGDNIDIINIAINAQQASNVFFAGFVSRIKKSKWFQGKYKSNGDGSPVRNNEVSFDKNINVYSGHSERESWEGYNVILVILDEIAGFAVDNSTGHAQAKTAEAIYDMYSGSVNSRFPDFGKILLLSFPRFRGDFIQTRYEAVIAHKEVVIRTHTYKIIEDLPDNLAGNELTITWEEDHIVQYAEEKVYALRRPTWDINPTRSIEDFKRAFVANTTDSLARFACMPPDAVDALFKDRERVEAAFNQPNPIDETNRFYESFQPEDDKVYYMHVDLAQKHDRAAVAMAHVAGWADMGRFMGEPYIAANVVVDFVRYWTPKPDKSVDFQDVKEFIQDVRRRGFNIGKVTFDRWNSHDMMMQLREFGLESDILSVAKKHYDDFKIVLTENRLQGPQDDILITELLRLQIKGDKVDHPRTGSKDLADAVCGSIYNSVSLTDMTDMQTIEIHDFASWKESNPYRPEQKKPKGQNVIEAPSREPMPDALVDYFQYLYHEEFEERPAPPGVIKVPGRVDRDRD